jgi:isochorismate synthase
LNAAQPDRAAPAGTLPSDPAPGAPGSLFAFQSGGQLLHGFGQASALPSGPVATLGERLAAVFRTAPDATVAGALPFDRAAPDCLWRAGRIVRAPAAGAPAPAPPATGWRIAAEPDAAAFRAGVRRALDRMAAEAGSPGGLEKIVLSRSLVATADAAIDGATLFRRLAADPAATAFLVPLPPRAERARVIAGATPELLLAKTGARIVSHPLAGSARRRADLGADAAAAAALSASDKDRREHRIVVEFILDTLAPLCRRLFRPEGTALAATASMWHLGTRIVGDLRDPDRPAALIAAALHPTPAVCGLPRARAADLIGPLEGYDRGFYAGAVGWCDGRGDGAWYVTIRCAEIADRTARLYAGAGIVPGSDPWTEVEETAAKFAALVSALGIPYRRETRP